MMIVGKKYRAVDDIVTITINKIQDGWCFYTVEASGYRKDEFNRIEEVEEELENGWEEIKND